MNTGDWGDFVCGLFTCGCCAGCCFDNLFLNKSGINGFICVLAFLDNDNDLDDDNEFNAAVSFGLNFCNKCFPLDPKDPKELADASDIFLVVPNLVSFNVSFMIDIIVSLFRMALGALSEFPFEMTPDLNKVILGLKLRRTELQV